MNVNYVRNLCIDCKKYEKQERKMIYISDLKDCYALYKKWMKTHFPEEMKNWKEGAHPRVGVEYQIIGSRPHTRVPTRLLDLIQNVETKQVYIMEGHTEADECRTMSVCKHAGKETCNYEQDENKRVNPIFVSTTHTSLKACLDKIRAEMDFIEESNANMEGLSERDLGEIKGLKKAYRIIKQNFMEEI